MASSSYSNRPAPADTPRPVAGVEDEAQLFDRWMATDDPAENAAIFDRLMALVDSRPTFIPSPLSAGKFSRNEPRPVTPSTAPEAPRHKGFSHSPDVGENAAPIVTDSSLSPSITTSKPLDLENVRKLLAVSRAKYQSSPREQKRQATLKAKHDEAERQAKIRAAGPFERLHWLEQINSGRDHFQAQGRVSNGTWLLNKETLALLRKQRPEKRLSWLMDRIRKALFKALGRHPAIIATMQTNAAEFEHLHVITDLTQDEYDEVEKALGKKGCCGTWKAKPSWKRRGEQFDNRPIADKGWTDYITRHLKKLARGDFYMNREFRDAALANHEAKRQAQSTPPAPVLAGKSPTGALAPVNSSFPSHQQPGGKFDDLTQLGFRVELNDLGRERANVDGSVRGAFENQRLDGAFETVHGFLTLPCGSTSPLNEEYTGGCIPSSSDTTHMSGVDHNPMTTLAPLSPTGKPQDGEVAPARSLRAPSPEKPVSDSPDESATGSGDAPAVLRPG